MMVYHARRRLHKGVRTAAPAAQTAFSCGPGFEAKELPLPYLLAPLFVSRAACIHAAQFSRHTVVNRKKWSDFTPYFANNNKELR